MNNRDVYALMTSPAMGKSDGMDAADLRIAADVGRLAVNDYLRGLEAIGNITFWACENENYTDHVHDLEALAVLLKHSAHMVRATSFYSDHADYMADLNDNSDDFEPIPPGASADEII
ncbi:hypothetical protein [Klebsiella pneumoniae]|uniref:Uncharacterized protein n=1 Tax=Klebsiella pneumoniae subsp. ozaenae TaxID=574 RepID=A0A378AWT4_KLEPO|nr:hypothetical protein [Klebsiella pneumoniae]STV21897.1 Uncharacterised protein [Klebsiella pneumoniae subsp. ozaenae]VFS37762.1 Uncharacterised protein [Serratia liquefaciens]